MKILKFKASWCQPCKSLTTQLEGISFSIPMNEIDIDDENGQEIAQMYGVRSVPTMVLVDSQGLVVDTLVGLIDTPTIAKTFGGQLLQ